MKLLPDDQIVGNEKTLLETKLNLNLKCTMMPNMIAIRYQLPKSWIRYQREAVFDALAEAKASVRSLTTTPFQRDWVEKLQEVQLKLEIAGTSRIEGADFTGDELDAALAPRANTDALATRSQRQAHAAAQTYRWIAALEPDRPITGDLIREVHRRLVSGCEDDHCQPGVLRGPDCNVIFGVPPHRGCEGGEPCATAFNKLIEALQREFREHDPLIQGLALHYHLAAMHPFMDGNGRTARAVEALLLQRAGLRDSAFVAMSNYYYDEKTSYLAALSDVRSQNGDLTGFLQFGLRGIALQCSRLFSEIRKNMQKALFRNTMFDLFHRLQSKRKRVIKERQIEILKTLLETTQMDFKDLVDRCKGLYGRLKNPGKALVRDVQSLAFLGAIDVKRVDDTSWTVSIRLDWPSEITESEFFAKIKRMPKGKTYTFLS